MRKRAKGKRPNREPGEPLPDKVSSMSAPAVDIAVSEITGIPLESLCGYVLFALEHRGDALHMLSISCKDNDFPEALHLAEHAMADLQQTVDAL